MSALFDLYRLHQVDSALYDMKQRAGALDMGREEAAQVKVLERDPDGVLREARSLNTELMDLELEQKSLDDKLAKLDRDLYGGNVVNPREVANIEKEIKAVHEHRSRNDARILEIWEVLPPAKERAASLEGEIAELQAIIAKKQATARQEHARLQQAYKAKAAERPQLLVPVQPTMLTLYESLKEKLGVGMALVSNDHRCEACGIHVPEKAYEFVVMDRVVQCEGCR